MAGSSKVLLLLGAGPNIGQSVVQAFAARGYKVATVSRKANESNNTADQVNIQGDLSDAGSVEGIFVKVKQLLGLPSVVVYNAAAATMNNKADPLSLSLSDFTRDTSINTHSAFAAAQQAVSAFSQLPQSASKTFIYTGNALNEMTMAPLLDLGVGKSATAHIIQLAADAYKDRGFKFYYADERKSDGSPAFRDISGDAHAAHYVELSEGNEQLAWQQTFVKGAGYRKF